MDFRTHLIAISTILALAVPLQSQTSPGAYSYPTDQSSGIEPCPTLTLACSLPISTSSITWDYPVSDSTLFNETLPPTVSIIPKSIVDSLPTVYWKAYAVPGTYSIVDDTVLTFQPTVDLPFCASYVVLINGLQVYDSTYTGITYYDVLADTIEFTVTCDFVPEVAKIPDAIGTGVACNDSIFVPFSVIIDSAIAQGLLGIRIIDSTTVDQYGAIDVHTSPVSCNVSPWEWAGISDSIYVAIVPTGGFQPGREYLLDVNLSLLTADSSDDSHHYFRALNGTTFNVDIVTDTTVAGFNPQDLIPLDMFHVVNGDTAVLYAQSDSLYVFHHWECEEIPTIDQSMDPYISIPVDCSILDDVALRAYYNLKKQITVTVDSTVDNAVAVYDHSWSYIGGAGAYQLPADDHLYVTSIAQSSGYTFPGWGGNDGGVPIAQFSPETQISILRNSGGNINIGPLTGPTLLPPNNGVCAFGFIDNGTIDNPIVYPQGGEVITGKLTITPSPCQYVGTSTTPINVTAAIDPAWQDCYCIDRVIIKPPGAPPQIISAGCVNSYAVAVTPTTPATSVYVVAVPTQTKTLTVSVDLDKVRKLSQTEWSGIGNKKDVTVMVEVYGSGRLKFAGYVTEAVNQLPQGVTLKSASRNFTLTCDDRVRLTEFHSIREPGFDFLGWEDGTGYSYPQSAPNDHISKFDVSMNKQNRQVQAYFEENFRLRKVGIYVDDQTNAPNAWVDPRILQWKGAEDINVWLSQNQGYTIGTKHRLLFNDAVNAADVAPGLSAKETGERLDFGSLTSHIYVSNDITFIDQAHKEIEVETDLLKAQTYNLVVDASIENQSNETLTNAYEFPLETEMPGVQVDLKSVKYITGGGDGGAELAVVYDARLYHKDGTFERSTGKFPNGWEQYTPPGSTYTINSTIMSFDKVKKTDYVKVSVGSFDSDEGATAPEWLKLPLILVTAALLTWLAVEAGPGWRDGAGDIGSNVLGGSAGQFIGRVIGITIGLAFLGGLWYAAVFGGFAFINWLIEDQDDVPDIDPLGANVWKYWWKPHLFGDHPDAKASNSGSTGNVEHNLDFKLKK